MSIVVVQFQQKFELADSRFIRNYQYLIILHIYSLAHDLCADRQTQKNMTKLTGEFLLSFYVNMLNVTYHTEFQNFHAKVL